MKLVRLVVALAALASVFATARHASAEPPCEPRVASTYRYDPTTLRTVFVLRLCEPAGEVAFEIQFERVNLITEQGVVGFVLGATDCPRNVCVVTYSPDHGNELARYDVRVFWSEYADDRVGPLVCATAGERAGCRPPPPA
jgi:hypothetical protein